MLLHITYIVLLTLQTLLRHYLVQVLNRKYFILIHNLVSKIDLSSQWKTSVLHIFGTLCQYVKSYCSGLNYDVEPFPYTLHRI